MALLLTFLDKEGHNNIDATIMQEFPPDVVLDFFQHSFLNISLEVYKELKDQFSDPDNFNENIPKWVLFIDKLLAMENDLDVLIENHHLDSVGPAYYIKTNTRFYFYRTAFQHEVVTASDIRELVELNGTPYLDDPVAKFYANLKCKPSNRKTREELLHDLDICTLALDASEEIKLQNRFQEHLIGLREQFLNAPYTALVEPEKPGAKPVKPEYKLSRLRSLLTWDKTLTQEFKEACASYNYELKIYYMNYREYEKSCDRYKLALREWETEKNHFINRSIEDIKKARLKVKKGNRVLKIYGEVLKSLDIHPNYHSKEVLQRFRYFIETGRAQNLQECMNLYEQEASWEDFKESQARIERNVLATVYYLHSETAATSDSKESESPDNLLETIVRRIKGGWRAL
ncbi:MAG: hypothetical protein ACM3UZ_11280 [Acidobacteriota bacterium]